MEITERDIKRVEEIFFGGNGSFEDEKGERYAFISCIDKSIDVEACPGSGKTTSLLAKLYLLSEKMPFENGKGICVLTHTNVAIDEIKKRLGNKADRLFKYPNFFGTIQSFVNKYLTIPFYAIKNEKRINVIDSERSYKRLLNSFAKDISRDDLNKVRTFLYANREIAYNLTIKRASNNSYELVNGVDGKKIELNKPRSRSRSYSDWSKEEKSELYKALFKIKLTVLKNNAILSFDDAYFYANEYLTQYPKIKQAISQRFSYVFIDEMQDTYAHQDAIIKEVFDQQIIIQRIGDPNQAILNDNNSESAWEDSERLKITGSKRFSQSIANVLRKVALNGDPKLTGTDEVTIPPYIIRYQNGQEPQALEKFVSLIQELGLDNDNKYAYPIKAVGWVGKEKDSLTISNYFPSFSKIIVKKKSLDNLKFAILLCETDNPKKLYNTVIDSCLEIFRLARIKRDTSKGERFYNKTSFLELLKHQNPDLLIEFNNKISVWGQKLAVGESEEVINELRAYLKDTFFPVLNFTMNKNSNTFIDNDELHIVNEEQIESNNTYHSIEEHLKHIPVQVGTVHSVKGETHRATLYLETFYHKHCGEHLIEQLIGIPYKPPRKRKDTYKKACLKIAHVGMSRPTHLLCIALNQDIIHKYNEELLANGWKII